MKLTAAYSAIKSASERLGMNLETSYSRILLLAEAGNFLWVLRPLSRVAASDGSSVAEQFIKQFFASKTDNAELAESVAIDFYKAVSDNGQLSDDSVFNMLKGFSEAISLSERIDKNLSRGIADGVIGLEDSAFILTKKVKNDSANLADISVVNLLKSVQEEVATSELISKGFEKSFSDQSSIADAATKIVIKTIESNVITTDDVDGAASLEDDQEVHFFKNITDVVSFTESVLIVLSAIREFSDSASISDLVSQNVGKATSSFGSASEAHFKNSGKGLSDITEFEEETSFDVSKNLADTPLVGDVHAFGLSRSLSDSWTVSDTPSLGPGKVLANGTGMTDEDTLSFGKGLSSQTFIAESIVFSRVFIRTPSDSTLISDAGSLRSQGYCDFTYFAEDFVGTSRTF